MSRKSETRSERSDRVPHSLLARRSLTPAGPRKWRTRGRRQFSFALRFLSPSRRCDLKSVMRWLTWFLFPGRGQTSFKKDEGFCAVPVLYIYSFRASRNLCINLNIYWRFIEYADSWRGAYENPIRSIRQCSSCASTFCRTPLVVATVHISNTLGSRDNALRIRLHASQQRWACIPFVRANRKRRRGTLVVRHHCARNEAANPLRVFNQKHATYFKFPANCLSASRAGIYINSPTRNQCDRRASLPMRKRERDLCR